MGGDKSKFCVPNIAECVETLPAFQLFCRLALFSVSFSPFLFRPSPHLFSLLPLQRPSCPVFFVRCEEKFVHRINQQNLIEILRTLLMPVVPFIDARFYGVRLYTGLSKMKILLSFSSKVKNV